ncbi:hypothetical protein MTsPCn5_11950 [Croceitalea sp. MTPC5]|uniref:monoheme cytochrome C n=1 Tax=Croceitalea sp. MTPC5 TaxID=3056565 RepID=UPI002B36DC3B|nr:hypothetical protein MTsPCn5_11950 [Croceitalea sp. MTPC5]
MDEQQKIRRQIKAIHKLLVIAFALFVVIGIFMVYAIYNHETLLSTKTSSVTEYAIIDSEEDLDKIENGIHVRTGLVNAAGLMEVVNNCTNCHSAQLVTQNRMDKESWLATIRWMQETQNLWDLGKNEEIIIDYLVTNYPPRKKGRRAALTDIDWYELEE